VDGLSGFREAIAAAYPKADIQRCIIHQIRSSTRYVSWKDIKALMADLKKVYQAVTEEEALQNLISFKEIWGKQYPSCVKSWEDNWDILSNVNNVSASSARFGVKMELGFSGRASRDTSARTDRDNR